jgi:Cdc6-like AAA superfamily ATPase
MQRQRSLRSINALDLEFMPSKLVGRDKQLKELTDIVVNTAFSNENVWIEGNPGLGKTLTAKFFGNQINKTNSGKALYMACEKSIKNSIDKVRLRYDLPLSKRDISSNGFANSVLKAFPNQKYYFIIDEPDKAYAKRDIANFVHCVWNFLIEESAEFSFIFVSKYSLARIHKVFPLDAKDTLSRLQLKPIIFPIYDAPEIVTILRQRLDLIMDNRKYDLNALFLLANHIHRVGGDMRQALEILRESYRIAHGGILSLTVVQDAIEWGKKRWWIKRLRSISPHWALIVFLAASYCKQEDTTTVEESTVIKLYNQATAKYNVEPLGPSTVYWIIKQLSGDRPDGEPFFEQTLPRIGLPAKMQFETGERDRIVSVGSTFDWLDMLTYRV